ncbi:hypothetical protein OIV83_002642 [Microbotryomycetes sp. JL201]|nr:hypothetical protein OIV83_002642 [Microbotryomycetes sp. JL201]
MSLCAAPQQSQISRSLPDSTSQLRPHAYAVHPSHIPQAQDTSDLESSLSFGHPSPQFSQASDLSYRRRHGLDDSPASSILSNGPSSAHVLAEIDYFKRGPARRDLTRQFDDRRDTIKPSHSTPAGLSSFASSSGWDSPLRQSGWSSDRSTMSSAAFGLQSDHAASSLEACLEDLRLMTEEDGAGLDGTTAALDILFSRNSGDFGEEKMIAPPPRRPQVPHSHSTPSLPLLREAVREPVAVSAINHRCTTCRKQCRGEDLRSTGDGQSFCRTCYADRFLPKCRKCIRPIEGSAVTSSDGKISGKYHPECFACFECTRPFKDAEFYVLDRKPCCQSCWHKANNSMCIGCNRPIEGPCVSLVGEDNGHGGRYHPEHFVCSFTSCALPLPDYHFLIGSLPYCEDHAWGPSSQSTVSQSRRDRQNSRARAQPSRDQDHHYAAERTGSTYSSRRAQKRKTIITLR